MDARPRVVIDRDRRVLWRSENAEKLLAPPVPLRLSDGWLTTDAVTTSNALADFIDGNAGFDTAVFHKDRRSYHIVKMSAGEMSVSDGVDIDTLKNIDALKFADGTMRTTEIVFDRSK